MSQNNLASEIANEGSMKSSKREGGGSVLQSGELHSDDGAVLTATYVAT